MSDRPSSDLRARRRPRVRLAAALAAAGMLIALVGVDQAQPSQASWSRSNYHNATLTSGVLNPVTSFTCNAGSGLIAAPINFTWTQPVITGNGLTPTSYTMSWSGSAGSGSTTVAGLTATLATGSLDGGNLTVSVKANLAGWESVISTQTRAVTLLKVVVLISWTCS